MAGNEKDTLEQYTMSERRVVHDRILMNILVQTYEHSETDLERNRVADAYKEYFGSEYEHFGQAMQIGMIGPPGHGKSSAYRDAAVVASKLLKLQFIECNFESIPRDIQVSPNTFFYSNMYMAGKQSPAAVTGMQVPDKDVGALVTMLPEAYGLASKAGASMVVFEDITAAPPQVQTALHMMFDDHVPSKVLRKVYFGYTGNLGKLDKTAASDLMSSLSTRVELHYCQTKAIEYQKYIDSNPKYNGGPMADAFISGFMEMQGETLFDPINTIGNQLNKKYCAPRTMDQFITSTRQELSRYLKQPGGPTPASRSQMVNMVQLLAQNTVGRNKSTQLQAYYNSVLGDAYPVVQEVLSSGAISADTIARCEAIYSNGLTPEAHSFRHALMETGSKFLGAKFAKSLMSEIDSENKPETEACCRALNILTFGTINESGFRATIVRKTMINALRLLEKEMGIPVVREKIGSISQAVGLVMNPFLAKILTKDLAEQAKSGYDFIPYSKNKEAVLGAYESFFRTNTQLKDGVDDKIVNAKL